MNLCSLILLVNLVFITLILTTIPPTSKAQSNEEAAEEGGGGNEEDSDAEEDEPEKPCKEIVFGLIRGAFTSITKCLLGQVPGFRLASPFELLTRLYCIVKCFLTDQGMVNEEGRLDEVAALFYFQDNLPASLTDIVAGEAQPCLAMADDFKSGEYYCNSFGPFVQCLFGSLQGAILPYIINCFGTPGIGAFFSLINFLIPPGSGAATNNNNDLERRRRITTQQQNTTLLAMLNNRRRNKKAKNKQVKVTGNESPDSWIHYARNITYFG